jgi:hypothetical protein
MRLLFTIAHFFSGDGAGNYGSRTESPRQRLAGLTACLASLHQAFGPSQHIIDWARAGVVPANKSQVHDVDVIICTTRGRHLLAQLPAPGRLYTHHPTRAEPMLLGFECQAVLRDQLGRYDYYCFLEDDGVLHDPWFFAKLNWFTNRASGGGLLQPNRYEVSPAAPLRKVYVDGDIPPQLTAPFQDVRERPVIARRVLGTRVLFRRALNPHAAGYFLSAEQMEHWVHQRYFLDRDTSFVGPLESAATLGIMRAFRVYKPAVSNAGFLEIQHFGSRFLRLSRKAVRELEEAP